MIIRFRRVVALDVDDVGDRRNDYLADGALIGDLDFHHTLVHLVLATRVGSLLQLGLDGVILFTN